MKRILIISLILVAVWVLIGKRKDLLPQPQNILCNQRPDSTISDFLSVYLDDNYLIGDSLVFDYGGNNKGVLITMFKENEEELEFKSLNDEPVKRCFFLFNEALDDGRLVFKSLNVLPSLGFGERFMTGYYKLTAIKDTIGFYTEVHPSTSQVDYTFHYVFVYDDSASCFLLNSCNIIKYLNDEIESDFSLGASDFGVIKMKDFNIYEFNPFVLL